MSLSHAPSIVRNGLVLSLDAANPKSFGPFTVETLVVAGGTTGGDIGISVTATTWVNLGLIINSDGSRSIYKNGVAVYSTSGSVGNTPTLNFQIGMLNNAYPLNGKCPVVQIYNRALTATEASLNFEAMRDRYGI
jgi:hypothetical protein